MATAVDSKRRRADWATARPRPSSLSSPRTQRGTISTCSTWCTTGTNSKRDGRDGKVRAWGGNKVWARVYLGSGVGGFSENEIQLEIGGSGTIMYVLNRKMNISL